MKVYILSVFGQIRGAFGWDFCRFSALEKAAVEEVVERRGRKNYRTLGEVGEGFGMKGQVDDSLEAG